MSSPDPLSNPSSAASLDKADYVRLSHFRHRLRRFLRVSERICQGQGLTPLQYQLLLHVRGDPDRDWASIGELAERLQAQHHGTVALIDRCEKLGLVERRPGRQDRRVVEIHLLPAGEEKLERIARLHQDELHQLLREFAEAEG
ncbi:MAG TPA: MarR family transcriptional regulator [Thiobacillaceae bacterium]|nr:MarR family transcriptional regulator [Thiobacillaceae bacterium]